MNQYCNRSQEYGIILVGYDVEARNSYGDFHSTKYFFDKVVPIHDIFNISSTVFLLGQTLVENTETIKALLDNPLWNIEQHTFSHVSFRNVEPKYERNKAVEGEKVEIIRQDIATANSIFKDLLGLQVEGICAPKGYYGGLKARPDILEILDSNGLKFIRSYGRNKDDWQPVPFEIQPFWYKEEGFPEILEIPAQGWQDTIWKRTHGWQNRGGYLQYLKESVNYVTQNRLVWSCGFHDWSCIREDPDLIILSQFFEYALEQGARFLSHLEFYSQARKEIEL